MKRMSMWCLLVLVLSFGSAWSQAGKGGGVEQAVAGLENKWLQSQKSNNPDSIAPDLADKAVFTFSDGRLMNKAEMLKDAKATKYASVDYEDLKVTSYGSTAIATGIFKAKGTDSAGKPMDSRERFVDTWLKMPNGKWQCVASATSPIKK